MSTSSHSKSIFLLGATGYVGGQVLLSLGVEFSSLSVRALARNLSSSKIAHLQLLHPKLEVIEGSLDDIGVIEAEAKKADIVINVAVAQHMNSVNATLRGLKIRATSSPQAPIYIHMAGTSLISYASSGELIVPQHIWTGTEFTDDILESTEFEGQLFKGACEAIVQANKTSPSVRTMILLPGFIYGIGPGIQKVTVPLRLYLGLASQAGHVGTIGPGRNVVGCIHVKDVANAVSAVLIGALQGKSIGEGINGFYPVVSKYMTSMLSVCEIIGDVFLDQGLVSESTARPIPFSAQVLEPLGPWADVMSSNHFCRSDRLITELGWSAKHTEAEPGESFHESLPKEIELSLKESALGEAFKNANAR
ncbi:hypothetical protein BDP27DRAFT_1421578 [Rhodocollybia butyracea]|uniref:NAD-dependent epimerase/dehydratase domain-containing protein n=1 Tax=Rhodocollybia butyracea TaxID=206335 RepID=A0A9P5PVI7_9AGAR|nr:hypothetical protein BDP27DRAFT_1421578 [Rhodocollybia butyracea]